MAEQEIQHESPKRVILIPVDHSKHSEAAFDWYYSNIHHKGDKLVIVHCSELHPPALPHAVASEEWRLQIEKHEKKIKELEEKYSNKCTALKIKAKIIIENSPVGHHICKIAKSENATMIVMASRGAGLIRRTILGSVSSYVVHHAHIPVNIVPAQRIQEEK